MNEIISKVAHAMAAVDCGEECWNDCSDGLQADYLNMARAAILAYEVARREAIEAQMREAFK